MARSVSTGASDSHSTVVDLVKIYYWDGDSEEVVNLTNASQNISADVGDGVQSFIGSGLALSVAAVTESTDFAGMGVDVALDGVDQSIIAIILQNQMRGRPLKIWKAWLNESTGALIGSPLQVFDGLQNEPHSIQSSQSGSEPGTVTVSTRAVTKLTRVTSKRNILSNEKSHNAMIERDGGTTGDTFFQNVPNLNDRVIQWGRTATQFGYGGSGRSGGIFGGPIDLGIDIGWG